MASRGPVRRRRRRRPPPRPRRTPTATPTDADTDGHVTDDADPDAHRDRYARPTVTPTATADIRYGHMLSQAASGRGPRRSRTRRGGRNAVTAPDDYARSSPSAIHSGSTSTSGHAHDPAPGGVTGRTAYGKHTRSRRRATPPPGRPIFSTTPGRGTDDLTVSGSGRYVRMYGTVRATGTATAVRAAGVRTVAQAAQPRHCEPVIEG